MTQWLGATWSRFWAVLRKERLDREFDEELNTHLDLLIDEFRRSGMSQSEARREGIRKLGRPESLREQHRELRGMPLLDVLAQDLRYAVRMLWKSRVFTCIAALSLALGIGANTALFSLVDDLLLRSLPVRAPERLVQVQMTVTAFGLTKRGDSFPKAAFDYIRTRNDVFSEVMGFNHMDRPLVAVDGVAEPSRRVDRASENFFRDLGVTPIIGRTPEPSDDAVAILGYDLWRDRFGGTPTVLGRTLTIDGQACSIVGVAPPAFRGLSVETSVDLWLSSRTPTYQHMIARLKPGVTTSQAQAAMQVLFRQLAQEQPGVVPKVPPEIPMQVSLLPAGKGLSQLRAQYERPLLALTVLVTLVLLITCTNVGNPLMLRSTTRSRELRLRCRMRTVLYRPATPFHCTRAMIPISE
jgi:hypothetical protein